MKLLDAFANHGIIFLKLFVSDLFCACNKSYSNCSSNISDVIVWARLDQAFVLCAATHGLHSSIILRFA